MTGFSDPAGRMQDVLKLYHQKARPEQSVHDTLCKVLKVASTEPSQRILCMMAGKVEDIDLAIKAAGDNESYRSLFDRNVSHWLKPVLYSMGEDRSQPNPGKLLVDLQSLNDLGAISFYLQIAVPRYEAPSPKDISAIRGQLNETVSAVRDCGGISEALRRAILSHLYAVMRALDYLAIGGPDSVVAATEELVGWFVVNPSARQLEKAGIAAKIVQAVRSTLTLLKVGTALYDGAEEIDHLSKIMLH
jgi:hypothetical protein